MPHLGDRAVSRRAVLGGAAAGVAGAGLAPAWPAHAGTGRDAVDRVASRLDRELIELRRDLHRHPEVAGEERRTARVVARRLRAAGLDVTTQPAEETLAGAAAMLGDGVFARTRPAEIHALHCGPFPVGQFHVMPGFGLPGQDRGIITLTGADALARARQLAAGISALGTVSFPTTSEGREQLVADIQTPDGPLAEFVFMQAEAAEVDGGASVRVSYRCWPEDRYHEVRESIHQLARAHGAASVAFPSDPFPAMVCPVREGQALKRYLHGTVGREQVGTLHAAIPFNGEDFALFLDQVPGTYTFLGVRRPGGTLESSYPHLGTFDPDERAIGHGVRAMAGWLASRM